MELAPGTTIEGDLAEIRRLDGLLEAATGPGHPASVLKLGTRSGNGASVAGVEGFLFIGDGANRWEQQYLHEQPLPQTWTAGWLRVLEQRQAKAAARGAALWNLVIPEKQVLYPEKRWPTEAFDGARRPWRQLEAELSPDLQVHYAEVSLRALRPLAPAYFRHNSHCTPSGCCAVIQGLLDTMGVEASLAELPLRYVRWVRAHDLSNHLFDPAPLEECIWLHAPGHVAFDNKLAERTGRYAGASYGLQNPSAPDPRRAIIFGDSYAYDVGLSFLASTVFAEVVFVWSKGVVWEEVDRHKSQVVICETAERFMVTLPES